jgi:nucleoside-diphosphate-sugar epimerase
MDVLVTCGTGTLGRHVVTQLRSRGHRARIVSCHPRGHVDAVEGDLATGAGLARAVAGVNASVHAASATTQLTKAQSIDVVGTRRLLAMAREAGVRHVVYVSIVGMEGIAYPYYKSIAESWLKASKLNKRLIPRPLPFKFSRQVASGRLLAADHTVGKITFEQYLEKEYPS